MQNVTTKTSIETDKKKHCHAIAKEKYKLKNALFDGQPYLI